MPLKFYEYLDTERPILATGGEDFGEINDILKITGTGFAANSIPKIEKVLWEAYKEYLLAGKPSYKGQRSIINKYSYEISAQKLLILLNKLASSRGN